MAAVAVRPNILNVLDCPTPKPDGFTANARERVLLVRW
jgi:hypothetical protein